ncbi:hypothetical protein EC973_006436 [Apophysomyces ossiformis]|uniref:Uncharacterized protein n=1 Tax=Apophysomyces ossiformis TaxID=679940 RepID=A0A8H7BR65_9FUNG|nr:hypothetical protein EC973_006436 [Apophysomyces ossiformis]
MAQSNDAATGKRAAKLDLCYSKWVDHILKHYRFTNALRQVRETRELPESHTKELEEAHKQASHYARSQLWNSYQYTIKEKRDFLDKLNALERRIRESEIIENGDNARLVPQPDEVVRAMRIHMKMKELRKLRNAEKELKSENRELMKQVTEKSDKLKEVSEKVIADLLQLKEATSMAISMPVEDFDGAIETLIRYEPEINQ